MDAFDAFTPVEPRTLLVDASAHGSNVKRRMETTAGDVEALRVVIAREFDLKGSVGDIEVWDPTFDEYVLLTDFQKQVPPGATAKLRLAASGGAGGANVVMEGTSPRMNATSTPQPPATTSSSVDQAREGMVAPVSSAAVLSRDPISIVVPHYMVNGSFDIKFVEDPRQGGSGLVGLDLKGLMTEQEYHDAIRFVNDTIKPARATTTDQVLLATGASMVTLVPFAIRQKKRKALRKKLLNQAIDEFNRTHESLRMLWLKSIESLVIERAPKREGSA